MPGGDELASPNNMMPTLLLLQLLLLVLLLQSVLVLPSTLGPKRISAKQYAWELDTKAMISQAKFPIKPAQLIAMTKEVINRDILDPRDLAEDFVFQFPVVGPLSKEEYLKAVGGFKIKDAFPDLNPGIHDFRVDPMQPNRVFYTVAFTATHTGESPLGAPTGREVLCPPQVNSLTFNAQGKVTKYTGGYVVDKDIGNAGGMGGLFGPLYAIGRPLPFPEAQPYSKSWQFKIFNLFGSVAQKLTKKI